MATGTSFDMINIRNCNIKINGSGISCDCSVEAGDGLCKDLNTFAMINQDLNTDMGNYEDGISNGNCYGETRDLGTLDERILNVFMDPIMLATSYMAMTILTRAVIAKTLLDFEDLIMLAVKTSLLKPLKMKELHAYEDYTITDMLRPLKAKMSNFLQDQLNWKMTTYDFDVLPG